MPLDPRHPPRCRSKHWLTQLSALALGLAALAVAAADKIVWG
jgi:hypothetical protein